MVQLSIRRDLESYRLFLRAKSLPGARVTGRTITVPDEYASLLGQQTPRTADAYTPPEWMFDYQAGVSSLAIRRRKFAAFVGCGMGKTAILWEFARYAAAITGRPFLIVSPLMVIQQTLAEYRRFYGEDGPQPQQIRAAELQSFLDDGIGIGVTNYEAIRPTLRQGRLGGLGLDESSYLKSHYGKWGTTLIRLGRGLEWKLCCTGTPAPNDRIEFANHAVFLDQFPTVNSFLAKYFINRGETGERWELKPHALGPFYRSLAAWSIFLEDPAVYGWKDNAGGAPPIHVKILDVALTDEQRDLSRTVTGSLFGFEAGGITRRSTLGQLAKGRFKGKTVKTHKLDFVAKLARSFGDRSVLIWAKYNAEQASLAKLLPEAANVAGDTPQEERQRLIAEYQAGRVKILISKPKLLGFGLNLQICTRMIFSGLEDSFESYHQAVKRANRYGSTDTLEVYLPVSDLERPMVESVLVKAGRVADDSRQQERIFKEAGRELLGI